MAKGNPVTWFEIAGKDGAKTQKFYSDLFGWKVDASNPMNYGMVECGEGPRRTYATASRSSR